ncbi:hypothetical protein NDU88_002511 [Pleurodeles waltl]|uniref:Uncharacterized protein n=1 Tax=Pleurodeles waltl TaxID=8319 RepID=A0AAV7WQ39_PLEWA|nr:hypothetical protein NDU88_002511 [Pleurodeles waltl]
MGGAEPRAAPTMLRRNTQSIASAPPRGVRVSSPHAPRPVSGPRNARGRGSTRDCGLLLRSCLQQRGRAPPLPADGTSGSSNLQCSPGAQDGMLDVRATPRPRPEARRFAELRS